MPGPSMVVIKIMKQELGPQMVKEDGLTSGDLTLTFKYSILLQ